MVPFIGIGDYTPSYISNVGSGAISSSGFYFTNGWMDTMKSNMGSEAAVRKALVPGAMVDTNGDLYCIYVDGFDETKGVAFRLTRCYPNDDGDVEQINKSFYPWYETKGFSMSSAGKAPYTGSWSGDAGYFRKYGHNTFIPGILQELIEEDSKICVYVPFHSGKFIHLSSSYEGMMYFDFKKNDLSMDGNVFYNANNVGVRRINDLRPYSGTVEPGPYTGWHANGYVHVNFIAQNMYEQPSTGALFHQYNTNYGTYSSFTKSSSEGRVESSTVCTRYIYYEGYVYGLLVHAGKVYLMRQSKSSSSTSLMLDFSNCFKYLDTYGSISSYTTYNYDFFITDDGMVGVIGFRPTTDDSSSTQTALTSAYNWSYVSWGVKKMCLVLTTAPLNASSVEPAEYSSNVIYATDVDSFTGAVPASSSSPDLYHLHLNTHKICHWVSPKTKDKYLVYVYCYPGKSKRAYLGYARYQKSGSKINLMTKFELKNNEDETFSNFVDCSRIISMDIRNEHLWITWMSSDNTKYYYFHIMMSDLIQEE